MITAVDTSVVLDVFLSDERFHAASEKALKDADLEGTLVVCEVVYAELAALIGDKTKLDQALARIGIRVDPLGERAAFVAGCAFRRYRDAGGPRVRILADFLIGAHALSCAARLLSRDGGFHRKHFGKLKVISPSGLRD